jgi:FecR protein
MNMPPVVSTAALLAWMLVGSPSGAQEPVSPATAAGAEATAAASSVSSPTVSANSKVRIVRLSEVKGQVQLDRLIGKGFEPAMANLPVIEGARLKTDDGVAEVEFEDNSTIRVGPNSQVEFPKLELLPGGIKASTVELQKGTIYASLVNNKTNQLSVKFGKDTVTLPPESHIRLQMTPTEADLAVMHGDVTVENPAGTPTNVGKNKTATFDMAGQNQPAIAKSMMEEPLDKWDDNAVQYHKSYANASAFGNVPYSYGTTDLNYYGSFVNGCGGSLWRPYFTSAAWDPYSSGAWAYYPSSGYSWVSPYPWGWTPYHYGSWSFCQGIGWGWMPGGTWMGLANNSFVSPSGIANSSGTARPRPPVNAPARTEPGLVGVNLKAMPASSLTNDKFVFRGDSAGLGVPRGNFGKLNGFSNHVAQHGMASTEVVAPALSSGARGGNGGQESSIFSASRSSSSNSANRSYSGSMQGPAGGAHSSMQSAAPSGGGGGGSAGAGGGGRR